MQQSPPAVSQLFELTEKKKINNIYVRGMAARIPCSSEFKTVGKWVKAWYHFIISEVGIEIPSGKMF